MSNATERWLPVVGYEGLYEVSDLGRVRGVDRLEQITGPRPGVRRRRGRILRQFPMKTTLYLHVRLSKEDVQTTRTVHSLVLEAFAGPGPDGTEARHLNGKHHDNSAQNLAWGTKSDNTLDQVAHGTHRNSRKTRCRRGHEYDYIVPGTNHRQCTKCRRANQARYRKAAKKAA